MASKYAPVRCDGGLASLQSEEVRSVIQQAQGAHRRGEENRRVVRLEDGVVDVPVPFPSPPDWRDCWIYFLLVDRFHNPEAAPRQPWDRACHGFQGGTLDGIRARLDYLQSLGVGALWLSPVLKNCQWDETSYHGYGIQDFLTVEPRFTSDPAAARRDPELGARELQALIDEAHARGIYVILDIVLHHAGDVFGYAPGPAPANSEADWSDGIRPVFWRDRHGVARPEWTTLPEDAHPDVGVWPRELQDDAYFRRQGRGRFEIHEREGDFKNLKELLTDFREDAGRPQRAVLNHLIRVHEYLIARFDIDGFRIDALKHIEPEAARIFGNAVREFALSIGKKNFFTFGEVADQDEHKIAHFIGRNTREEGDIVGVDAALDFPLFHTLRDAIKGFASPAALVDVFARRRDAQQNIISSLGDAGLYFVTFLDNHDQWRDRFLCADPAAPGKYDDQLTLAIGCLFTLLGIPCLYYGTEQGLDGTGEDTDAAVREALWGKPNAFDQSHPLFQSISQLAAVRREQAPLRYGRQYFRPISGDGHTYGISPFPNGVLAFSRVLSTQEIVIAANTHVEQPWSGAVIVDYALNPQDTTYQVLFSNKDRRAAPPGRVQHRAEDGLFVHDTTGHHKDKPIRTLPVSLAPMEIQILGKVEPAP